MAGVTEECDLGRRGREVGVIGTRRSPANRLRLPPPSPIDTLLFVSTSPVPVFPFTTVQVAILLPLVPFSSPFSCIMRLSDPPPLRLLASISTDLTLGDLALPSTREEPEAPGLDE